jgi:hypothetical protein
MTVVGEGMRSWLSRRQPRPGPHTWGGGKLLPGLYRPLGKYAPVLALTVLRYSKSRPEILVGVRDPMANETHQNVASVPTRRIQHAVAREWLRRLRTHRAASLSGRTDLRDEVANIFSRKLGLSDAQERGHVDFDVESVTAFQGVSVIGERPDGGPVTENLTMFNALVVLRKGDDKVPPETASYNPLVWADMDDFVAMTRTRDVGRLNAGLERWFFCAYGLCLQTSTQVLMRLPEGERPQ